MKRMCFSLGHTTSTVVECSLDTAFAADKSEAVYVTDETVHRLFSPLFSPGPPIAPGAPPADRSLSGEESAGAGTAGRTAGVPGTEDRRHPAGGEEHTGAPQLEKTARSALSLLPAGETAKNWDSIKHILQTGFELGMARDGQFIGIGGGVITDLTAFAASVFMRGCDLVLVPTTILAMVDAAFGGKTGINFGGYKNLVGTFYPAREVRICTNFVTTLPDREYMSGLGEVIKCALLGDVNLLDILENRRTDVLARLDPVIEELVFRSIAVKGRVVEADLTENGVRAHLNLGHTFAHALESVAGLGTWSHGEAVAWGIVKALELGVRIGVTAEAYLERVRSLIGAYGFRVSADADPQELVSAMKMDKKKKGGRVRFILQKNLCDTSIREAPDEEVLAVLRT